jgi:hypothetical protein
MHGARSQRAVAEIPGSMSKQTVTGPEADLLLSQTLSPQQLLLVRGSILPPRKRG